jgi:HlyD family secretion protein
MSPNRRRRKWFAYSIWLILLLLVIGTGAIFLKARRSNSKTPTVPSAVVKLGDFIDNIELRGEIAVRSSTVIAAPYNAGDNLQILKLAPNGSQVKKGDVVVQFDASSLQRTADQARATLKQVEAEIAKANAQQRLSEEQILTEVMSAKFGVERARLDASTRDVIPAIENEKNVLALGKAEQKLKELDTKMASRRVGTEADLAGIFRRRDKAKADLEQAEKNSDALTLISPMDGIITMLPNSRARTNLLGGGSTPVFKEGDRCYAGASIAEIPDLSTIQAKAPLSEADRGRVQQGQPVILNIEAIPDKEHKGRIGDISSLAKVDYANYPIKKSFDLAVQLENPDPRLRPGMTATLRVEVERIHDSIVIPAEAVFQKNGQTVAYVLSDNLYRERPLTLARRGSGQVMVLRGLKPGERIALKDPTAEEQK